MRTGTRIRAAASIVLVLAGLPAGAAAGDWLAYAGWLRSDVGLHEKGDGLTVGAGRAWALPVSPLEFMAAVEYAARAGAQPMVFSDPQEGITVGSAAVRLHCLQPSALLAAPLRCGPLTLAPCAGAGVSLKLQESWDTPPGAADRILSYEDVDVLAQAGLILQKGPLLLQARWSWGLTDQLVVVGALKSAQGALADDPLSGVAPPAAGARFRGWQLTAGVRF